MKEIYLLAGIIGMSAILISGSIDRFTRTYDRINGKSLIEIYDQKMRTN